MMERREHFGKIVLTREGLVKRVGVDVGGTFTDLIYVDDEAGPDPRPQAADDARRPVAGNGAGHPRDRRAGRGSRSPSSTRSSTARRSRRTS